MVAKKKLKSYELIRKYDKFERSEWVFTHDRTELIQDIRRSDDKDGWDSRFKSAFYWLFTGGGPLIRKELGDGIHHRVGMFIHCLKRSKNQPDGYLNNGTIITEWCEDGSYIELFQPSVGQLIADFLEQEPNHSHAKKISKEIERIGNRGEGHTEDSWAEEVAKMKNEWPE